MMKKRGRPQWVSLFLHDYVILQPNHDKLLTLQHFYHRRLNGMIQWCTKKSGSGLVLKSTFGFYPRGDKHELRRESNCLTI